MTTLEEIFGLPPGAAWQEHAACAHAAPELFIGDNGEGTDLALRICRRCPVQQACLDYALEHDERFGIWGGLNARERAALRRGRGSSDGQTTASSEP